MPEIGFRGYLEQFEKLAVALRKKRYEILPVTEKYDFQLTVNPKNIIPTEDYTIWKAFPQEDVPSHDWMFIVGKIFGRKGEIQTINHSRLDRFLSRYNFER